MRVTSKRGEREIELDARERRVLTEAVPVLHDFGQLADEDSATEAAEAIALLLKDYPAKDKRTKVAK